MKFKTLNGKEVGCDVASTKYPMRSREDCRSLSQFHLGQQLKQIYTPVPILEEFPIPESRLSLDFYIPIFQTAFEFQGEQHDAYNAFFHESKDDFLKQKARDEEKRKWCQLNGIMLIEVRDAAITIKDLKQLILETNQNRGSSPNG